MPRKCNLGRPCALMYLGLISPAGSAIAKASKTVLSCTLMHEWRKEDGWMQTSSLIERLRDGLRFLIGRSSAIQPEGHVE